MDEKNLHVCIECHVHLKGRPHAKYCSNKCKSRYRKKNPVDFTGYHKCRVCEKEFPVSKGQHNKWLCSDQCRKASITRSVGAFHKNNPEKEREYRNRSKEKVGPDSNLKRFYNWNPNAPRCCEACGENRVLEIAHKPGYERIGRYRSKANSKWPEMVWVLCPTHHRLIDRMNYEPAEFNLF